MGVVYVFECPVSLMLFPRLVIALIAQGCTFLLTDHPRQSSTILVFTQLHPDTHGRRGINPKSTETASRLPSESQFWLLASRPALSNQSLHRPTVFADQTHPFFLHVQFVLLGLVLRADGNESGARQICAGIYGCCRRRYAWPLFEQGIVFLDIFPIMRDPVAFEVLITHLVHHITSSTTVTPVSSGAKKVDVVVGLDARGFLLGPIIALRLGEFSNAARHASLSLPLVVTTGFPWG